MQKKGKINLDEIIGDYVVKNTSAFNSYLKQLWKDLSNRAEGAKDGVDRISFGKYYDLPGLISERLFSVFDSQNKGFLSIEDFTRSMIKLFSGDYEQLLNFIFDFYDFDKDHKITKEDIRIVLSYVPLYKKIKRNQGLKFEKDNFQDRLASQRELHEKLDKLFKNKQIINFSEFKYITQNINSDIFLYILVFLMERRPFSNETIKNLDNIKKNNDVDKLGYKSKPENYIVLPNIDSKLSVSRTISSKSPTIRKSRYIDKISNNVYRNYNKNQEMYMKNKQDILALNAIESEADSIQTNGTIQKKPSRKTLKNVSLMDIETDNEIKYIEDQDDGLLDYARPYELFDNKELLKIKKLENDEDKNNINNNNNNNIEDDLNSTQLTNASKLNDVLTEGYLLKIKDKKVKKIYFKLKVLIV